MSARVTYGIESPSVAGGGGGGGGPSGIVIPFLLYDDDGVLQNSIDLSGAGVVKVSIGGADFVNAVGSAPTNIAGRTGHYYYILDDTEVPDDGSFVILSVVKSGYKGVREIKQIGTATATDVTNAKNNINAAISAAISAISGAINTSQIAIQTDIDALPTAAEIDTQLTSSHGSGSWTGATAAAIVSAMVAYSHDTGVTFGGLMKRIEAVLTGKATGLNGPVARFFMRDATTIAVEITIDPSGGTRGPSDVSGTEP